MAAAWPTASSRPPLLAFPRWALPPGRAGARAEARSAAAPRETFHLKQVNSSFIGTSLERDLRAEGVEGVIVVGLTTNHCVSTTARMSGYLGFPTYVVEDATAAFDRLGLDGRLRPAAEVHAAALSDLAEEFATVVRTDEILRSLDADARSA